MGGAPLRLPSNGRTIMADATQYFDPLSIDMEDDTSSPNDVNQQYFTGLGMQLPPKS